MKTKKFQVQEISNSVAQDKLSTAIGTILMHKHIQNVRFAITLPCNK